MACWGSSYDQHIPTAAPSPPALLPPLLAAVSVCCSCRPPAGAAARTSSSVYMPNWMEPTSRKTGAREAVAMVERGGVCWLLGCY